MLELNTTEYEVTKQVESGIYTAKEMELDMPFQRITHALAYLTKRGVLNRVSRGVYERTDAEAKWVEVKSWKPALVEEEREPINTDIDDEKKAMLIKHYEKMTRSQLAKKLGIRKLELNQIIIENKLNEVKKISKAEQNQRAYEKRRGVAK
jgi:restriction endonuclease Mrr